MLLKDVLIIFVKYPKPGSVKTRLAKQIGKEKAALLYHFLVKTVLARTKSRGYSRIIFYSPEIPKKRFKEWLGGDFIFYPQKGSNLGKRLLGAFKFIFKHDAKRIVCIGTDSPLINSRIIDQAFRILRNKQCVLGPADDGGYYLIGLSSLNEGIFKGISWGAKKVFRQTLEKIKSRKIEYGILDKSFDIDTYEDIAILRKGLKKAYCADSGGIKLLMFALDNVFKHSLYL